MGCVRDNIQCELFARNILDFQHNTGALVRIIIYNEKSYGTLRNGLSYTDFKEHLQYAISSQSTQLISNRTVENISADEENVRPQSSSALETSVSEENTHVQPLQVEAEALAAATRNQCQVDQDLCLSVLNVSFSPTKSDSCI
uniref:Uncharacterized protein n=1 Tax=Graphocephala atropunctata TaxID=36148 RepID=A0A1B6KT86_9HEMI